MTQAQRRLFLIQELRKEQPQFSDLKIPKQEAQQKDLLRSLFNIRPPQPVSRRFLQVQDDYLQEETRQKGITALGELTPVEDGIYLWQGDITTLECDAIVNAANRQMLGCFVPCHGCIDNAIHTYAGVQLRLACARLMEQQGREEETGKAKITPAFNLPCRWVIHTVGPIVYGRLTQREEELLADCYRSCLELAVETGCKSIAFCCISTGEFHFPNQRAAEIALQTVHGFQRETGSKLQVVFNVFRDQDKEIYQKLFGGKEG